MSQKSDLEIELACADYDPSETCQTVVNAREIGFFDEEADPIFLRGRESHLIEQTEEEIEEANYLDSFIHLPKDSVKTSKNPSGHHLSQKS